MRRAPRLRNLSREKRGEVTSQQLYTGFHEKTVLTSIYHLLLPWLSFNSSVFVLFDTQTHISQTLKTHHRCSSIHKG